MKGNYLYNNQLYMSNYREKKQRLKELVKKQEADRIKKVQEQGGYQFKDTDKFKHHQKHYKYYVHLQTDYSKLIQEKDMIKIENQHYQIYALNKPQGAYLVKKFCKIQQQLQLGYEALNYYIHRPYRTNLDGTNGLYKQGVYQEKQEQPVEEISDENGTKLYYFNEKIRMANLGYQYDWPHRSYPSTKVPVPKTVSSMVNKGHKLFEEIIKKQVDYHGESVIVNFYKLKDYMTGHLDDGQQDQVNPIFSFCFGLSCVFLIGGPTRDIEPVAVKLDSGDLLIMSGFSRICYHGVPRIIEHSFMKPNEEILKNIEIKDQNLNKQENQIKPLNGISEIVNYFSNHRLNINVRQVYKNKQKMEEKINEMIIN